MKPMLGVAVKPSEVSFPVYASAKLDGVRGVVGVDGILRSRTLKRIPNARVSDQFSKAELAGLDGEIIVGEPNAHDVCRQTVALCSRERFMPSSVIPTVRFFVFDDFTHGGTFGERHAELQRRAATFPPNVTLLTQVLVRNLDELLAYEEQVLALGFEGLILRSPSSSYKEGRSTAREQGMLKIKRFDDSEAEIIEVVEEMENTNAKITNEVGRGQRSSCKAGLVPKGRAGALAVRDIHTGIEFKVGAGFDDADRAYFWTNRTRVVGQIIKYKSFNIGVKTAPRFPIYLGGRERWDIGEAA